MLSGPGVIAPILLLTSEAVGDPHCLAVAVAITFVFIVTFVSLYFGARLISRVGEVECTSRHA